MDHIVQVTDALRHATKYTYDKDDSLFLVPEMDCLRVYSSLKHEIIRCVGARGRREA